MRGVKEERQKQKLMEAVRAAEERAARAEHRVVQHESVAREVLSGQAGPEDLRHALEHFIVDGADACAEHPCRACRAVKTRKTVEHERDELKAALRAMMPPDPFECGFCRYCCCVERDEDDLPGKHDEGCEYERARLLLVAR